MVIVYKVSFYISTFYCSDLFNQKIVNMREDFINIRCVIFNRNICVPIMNSILNMVSEARKIRMPLGILTPEVCFIHLGSSFSQIFNCENIRLNFVGSLRFTKGATPRRI